MKFNQISYLEIHLILIQDLTLVNGEVLALYTRGPNDFYIERWVQRRDGWDVFLLVKVLTSLLLEYLEGKTSLFEMLLNHAGKQCCIKQVKGDEVFLHVSHNRRISEKILPKRNLFLRDRTDFLDNDKYNKIISLSKPPFFNIDMYNLGPQQNWGTPIPPAINHIKFSLGQP